jgi:hypothetical protein
VKSKRKAAPILAAVLIVAWLMACGTDQADLASRQQLANDLRSHYNTMNGAVGSDIKAGAIRAAAAEMRTFDGYVQKTKYPGDVRSEVESLTFIDHRYAADLDTFAAMLPVGSEAGADRAVAQLAVLKRNDADQSAAVDNLVRGLRKS